jgi:hypothetical protein
MRKGKIIIELKNIKRTTDKGIRGENEVFSENEEKLKESNANKKKFCIIF